MLRQTLKFAKWHVIKITMAMRHHAAEPFFVTLRNLCPRPLFARLIWLLVAGIFFVPMDTMAAAEKNIFRVGFSRSFFADVNENDAMAAIKVWATMIARERNVKTDPNPSVYKNVQEMERALKDKRVECITLTVEEFGKLRHLLDDEVFLAGRNGKSFTEEYLVLVHRDSDIQEIGDLHDRRLCIFQSPRMVLAPAWLDTVLLEAKLPCASDFCSVTTTPKLTSSVLPVFFHQADACVVSRNSFETMCELNPQLKQQLKIIASSPGFVPSGFSFRRSYTDDIRKIILSELTQFLSSPAGSQFMTLFQLNRVEVQSPSCLDSALELIARHEQLVVEDKQRRGQSH